jgi:predicted dehydrogenase
MQLIEAESLDFVDVCVPHHYHRNLVLAAAERGLHVICEKPLATNLADAEAMIHAAGAAGVWLAVCHNWSCHPVFATLKRAIADNVVGRILQQHFEVLQTSGIWRGSAQGYQPEWRTQVELSGGGALMDTGFHLCYLSQWLAGAAPVWVSGFVDSFRHRQYSVEDYARVLCRYDNGSLLDLCASWSATEKLLWGTVEGEGGSLEIPSPFSRTYAADSILLRCSGETREIPILRDDSEAPASWAADFAASYRTLFREIAAVFSGQGGSDYPIRAEDGYRALEMVLASYQSAALEQGVRLPLASDGPVYSLGVQGLRKVDLSPATVLFRKNIFGVRGPESPPGPVSKAKEV